jgi:Mo-dependent nitrogenase C-terminus
MNISHSCHQISENSPPIDWMSYYLPTLGSLRCWLDRFTVSNQQQAEKICRLIPAQCPFERDIKIFGRTILHIPPLCKLNPCYEELVGLRFRAMCYLADECGMDISHYC